MEKKKRRISVLSLVSWILFGGLSVLIVAESATPTDPSGAQSMSLTRLLADFFNMLMPGKPVTVANPTEIKIVPYGPSAEFEDGQRKNLFEPNEAIIGTTKLFTYNLSYAVDDANIYNSDVKLTFTKTPGEDSFTHTFTTNKNGGALRIIPLKVGEYAFTLKDAADHVTSFSFTAKNRIEPKDILAKSDLISLQVGQVSRLEHVMTFGDLKRDDGTVDHYLARYYDRDLTQFTSSNEAVVKVGVGGILTAQGEGDANILYQGKTVCPVHVQGAFHHDVASITLTSGKTTISPLDYDYYYGSQLKVHYFNSMGVEIESDLPVGFTSADPLKALVDNDHLDYDENGTLVHVDGGFVSGYREMGQTSVRAHLLQDPTISAEVNFTSEAVLPTSVEIKAMDGADEVAVSGASIQAGHTITVSTSFQPLNASNTAMHVDLLTPGIAQVLNNDTNNPSISLNQEGNLRFKIYSVSLGEASAKEYVINVLPKPQIDDTNIGDFHTFIRKAAGHFSLFFVTGIFAAIAMFTSLFRNHKFHYLIDSGIALGSGLFLAGISEFIQTIPALNRGGSIVDVGIDFFGFAVGAGITLAIIVLIRKLRRPKEAVPESE